MSAQQTHHCLCQVQSLVYFKITLINYLVEQIHDLCDMHLVYLGHNTYGKLREKSAITPSIEVTQDMVNACLNRISSLHRSGQPQNHCKYQSTADAGIS